MPNDTPKNAAQLPATQFKPRLVLVGNRPMTTSMILAEHFGKLHKNVLRDIDDILAELPAERRRLNFEPTSIAIRQPNGGVRTERAFRMTRDGFALLAMGFTGREALRWKVAYIEAFNKMEDRLRRDLGRAGAITKMASSKHHRSRIAIVWFVNNHGGEGVPVRTSAREVARFVPGLTSHTAVQNALVVMRDAGDVQFEIVGKRGGTAVTVRQGMLAEMVEAGEALLAGLESSVLDPSLLELLVGDRETAYLPPHGNA